MLDAGRGVMLVQVGGGPPGLLPKEGPMVPRPAKVMVDDNSNNVTCTAEYSDR